MSPIVYFILQAVGLTITAVLVVAIIGMILVIRAAKHAKRINEMEKRSDTAPEAQK